MNFEYSGLDFYQLSSMPVAINEQFETEIIVVVDVTSQINEKYISRSALMACSCITNFYPLYEISKVEVTAVP